MYRPVRPSAIARRMGEVATIVLSVCAVEVALGSPAYPKGWVTSYDGAACIASNEIAPSVTIAYRWPGHNQMAQLFVHGARSPVRWNLDTGQHHVYRLGNDGLVLDYADTSMPEDWATIDGIRVSFGDDATAAFDRCMDHQD